MCARLPVIKCARRAPRLDVEVAREVDEGAIWKTRRTQAMLAARLTERQQVYAYCRYLMSPRGFWIR